MRDIVPDAGLVANCGLYCGACRAYLKEKCPGCHGNLKATWCKIRVCCKQHGFASCADCRDFASPNDCKLFNNPVAKIFALLFRSDRAACIHQIRALGIQGHADDMCRHQRHTIKK